MDELSFPGYCDYGAGHTFGGDLAGEEFVEPRQSLLRESDFVRLCIRQRPGNCYVDNNAENHSCGHHERLHCFLLAFLVDRANPVFAEIAADEMLAAARMLGPQLHVLL